MKTAAKKKTRSYDTEDGVPTPIRDRSNMFDMVRWDKTIDAVEYASDDAGELTLWWKAGATITFLDVPRGLFRLLVYGSEPPERTYAEKVMPYYRIKGVLDVGRAKGKRFVVPQPYLQSKLEATGQFGYFEVPHSSGKDVDRFEIAKITKHQTGEKKYVIRRYRSSDSSIEEIASFPDLLSARKWISTGMAMTHSMVPETHPDMPTKDSHVMVAFTPYPGHDTLGVMAVSADQEGGASATRTFYRDIPRALAEAMRVSSDPLGLLKSMRGKYPVLRSEPVEGIVMRTVEPAVKKILDSADEADIESILQAEPGLMAAIGGGWYKLAALMNKATHPDYIMERPAHGNLYIQCMYCGRWASDTPNPGYDPQSENFIKASKYQWKTVAELANEPEEMNLAMRLQNVKNELDRMGTFFGGAAKMSPEQRRHVDALEEGIKENAVSHGICPYCMEIVIKQEFIKRNIEHIPTPQSVEELARSSGPQPKPPAPIMSAVPAAPQAPPAA